VGKRFKVTDAARGAAHSISSRGQLSHHHYVIEKERLEKRHDAISNRKDGNRVREGKYSKPPHSLRAMTPNTTREWEMGTNADRRVRGKTSSKETLCRTLHWQQQSVYHGNTIDPVAGSGSSL